ncbi:MAG: hypothetical protein JXQ96_10685 [Cyclobacteriaceae bacterium]
MDTLKAYYESPIHIGRLEEFPKIFESQRKVIYEVEGIHFTVFLRDDLPVKIVFEGSIPKFLYKSNVKRSTRVTLFNSLMKLKKLSGIDVFEFTPKRTDMAINIALDYPIINYTKKLDYMRDHYRQSFKSSVYFKTKSKTNELLFYDKIQELTDKGLYYANRIYLHPNVKILRVEYRNFDKLRRVLKVPKGQRLTLRDLCFKENYKLLLLQLEAKYNLVKKKVVPNLEGVKKYKDWLLINTIQNVKKNLGTDIAKHQLEDLVAKGLIKENEKKYFLAEYNKTIKEGRLTDINDFVEEMDRKFTLKMRIMLNKPYEDDYAYAI